MDDLDDSLLDQTLLDQTLDQARLDQARLEQARLEQAHKIDKFGWVVMNILPEVDGPGLAVPFAYTVGLARFGFPELLITGLPPDIGHALLNDLAARVYDKAVRFVAGQRVSGLVRGRDVVIVEDGSARVRLQQAVWPDHDGRFPWEPGYALSRGAQPLIRHRPPKSR